MNTLFKIIRIFLALFFFQLSAQTDINFGDFSSPVPSVSSLQKYTNTPTTNATGIPDISFPLLQLPTYNNGFTINATLSYNTGNVLDEEPSSQVGRGWALFTGGIISRSIIEDLDEIYDNKNSQDYFANEFDDIYYYNIPGTSGKFRIKRDVVNNTFRLINLTANKLKIEYTSSSNTATLIFDSFTITDTKGIKYIFNDYSRSNLEQGYYQLGGKLFRSAFFLTQIRDAENVLLATFTYQKDIRYKSNTAFIRYETCKVKTITSPGFGIIEFDYLYNPAFENTMNDQYQLQSLTLKDSHSHLISQYNFEYSLEYSFQLRHLSKIKKLDKNLNIKETTEFKYYDPISPQYGTRKLLNRVMNPLGGVTEYNFEVNQKYDNSIGANINEEGYRIGSIKYYNSKSDTQPSKTTKYEYNNFTSLNQSSGSATQPDGDENAHYYILYKNVKVSNQDDANGYIKYYFKVPDDFPKEDYNVNGFTTKFWPQYNLISNGLLHKKEVYNAQNVLLSLEETNYTLQNIPSAEDYLITGIYTKLGWISKINNLSIDYFGNKTIQSESENNFNVFNFELASTKKYIDGNITETILSYPETGYSSLINSNIKSIPIVTEEKIDGEIISKREIKYDNPLSTRPSSFISSGIDNSFPNILTVDRYDEVGNILQFTSASGIPTAIIYGYSNTKPIAKIEGSTYAQVAPFKQEIDFYSNLDAVNSLNEESFIQRLDGLRKKDQLKDFHITTYSYNPLIGSTTITPPNGIREIYTYDNMNKLEKIVDMDGFKLKEFKYNNKN